MLIDLFTAKRETTSDALQKLAISLQPLFQERERVLGEAPSPTRDQRLQDLGRRMRLAGLERFHQLIERVCRSHCAKYDASRTSRFEVEDFVIEVLTLTCAQLPTFDPKTARFSTWFSACILPRIYSEMQRRINPSWGRPQPKTQEGQWARQEVMNIVRNVSLDQPTSTDSTQTYADRVADQHSSSEMQILEEQCRAYFLQAIAQLSEAEQVLFRRVYVLQEPQKEIAQALGVTPAAISQRLKKTYQRLAELLGMTFEAECAETQFCEALRKLP
ncbi:MAG: sigma-70 family RNA polymerase sigma factor [Anaerolineae bacterium]|nr:sigma-70 family RNA polymerase sigma factor [Gloeobacterales cyanobacterium ES-bin-313]